MEGIPAVAGRNRDFLQKGAKGAKGRTDLFGLVWFGLGCF